MGKATRNRTIRRLAREVDASRARKIARAFRRHGRMPLEHVGGGAPEVQSKWTTRNRRMAKKYSDFRRPKKKGK